MAVITGIGWVNSSGRGQGRQAVFQAGRDNGPLELSAKGILDKAIPRYGRMDDYSRLGLLAIALALKDARLDRWTERRNIAVISSTVFGCLQTDSDYYETVKTEGGRLASPNLFAYTLSNTFLGEVAIYFGLTGAGFIIHESRLSGCSGLILAMNSLAGKEYEAVVAGICDEVPSSFPGLTGQAVSGALFLVLQPVSEKQTRPYGTLTQDRKGDIFFEGHMVQSLPELAGWCTRNRGKNPGDPRNR